MSKAPWCVGPVVPDQPGAVHREHDVQPLQADVVDDLVVGALEEGGVDRRDRLRALERQASGEEDRVLLGDAHVVVALRQLLLEDVQAGAGVHGRGDADHPVVAAALCHERVAEDGRVLRRRGLALLLRGEALARRSGTVDDRARLCGVPLLHALEPAVLGRREALALHRLAVNDDRPVGLECLADRLAQRLHVVAVDDSHVRQVELFEDEPGRPVGLERLLEDRPEPLDALADAGGEARERHLGVLTRVVELGIEPHAREVARQRSHVGGDRHAVVVHHDHDRHAHAARVVERLERDSARERAIADHGDHATILSEAAAHRLLHPDRVGHRRGRVSRAHRVVLRLRYRAEGRQAAVLADRVRGCRGGR